MAQPVPESQPRRSGGTRRVIIALLKVVANSAPIVAMTKPASAIGTAAAEPGTANQSIAEPMTRSAPKAAIQGLRGPVLSAMPPSRGESRAMQRPAKPVA